MLALLFLIAGCASTLEETEENSLDNATLEPEISVENDSLETDSSLTSGCQEGWTCLSSSKKVYRYENCSFGERRDCKFGCSNNTCNPASVCTVGFKCQGDYYRGYQQESCDWINKENCEYGCVNATCKPKPNVTQEETASESAPSSVSYPMLKVGETASIGTNSTLRIYLIEEGQVRLQLDDWKTDWIIEGGNVSFRDGTMIIIKEILFQSYSNGVRAVSYKVG